GQTKPFLHEMVFAVRDLMQDAYPELNESVDRVSKAVLAEETKFSHSLDLGFSALETELDHARQASATNSQTQRATQEGGKREDIQKTLRKLAASGPIPVGDSAASLLTQPSLDGAAAFKLYDTFGLPRDFIEDACRDQGFEFDQAGFDRAMSEQRERARASWKGAAKQTANPAYQQLPKSAFEGYRQTRSDNCEVLAIIKGGQGAQKLRPGDSGEIILDHTPFYAESGGQVGDRGWLVAPGRHLPNVSPSIRVDYFGYQSSPYVIAEVTGCYYPVQGVRAHQVVMKSPPSAKNAEGWGTLRVGDKVDAVVNTAIREATMRNHTATHLLQAGLHEVLGKHVKQAGSLVAPNHLRFDFSHFTGVAEEELQDIEDIINKEVL